MLLSSLDRFDLTGVHTALCLFGALLALYLMQLTSHEHEDGADPLAIRWARRATLAFIAITLLACILYSDDKGWQPWPPHVALVLGVVLTLAIRTAAIRFRIYRDGSRAVPARNTVVNRTGNAPAARG